MSYPRRPAPHSVSGSALVLTLLITALLATIVVSFLSTSRVEMMAARNFSRQNAASGLAELATQQAMAQIQLGFNTTANMTGNYTSVVTTQPGAIHKYFFQNGTMTWNSTVEQFSAGNMSINGTVTPLSASISNETVNLNNLSNPRGNATGNLTLTGNAFEQINVQMEEVQDSSGNLVGRVAYYVDDEGTKLNVNNATGNRTTLNAGSVRSLSFSALSSNYAANFTAVVDGSAGNGTSTVKNWAHFFRPEQVGASLGNSSAAPDEITTKLPFISTATTSCNNTANMTHLLTPWGTQRIAINTLSTNATDGTGDASVRSIFEALTGLNATSVNGTYTASNSTYGLTGQGLQNIFGGNFSTKYTPVGVKQIAANMLQMRDPNTATVNASFSYQGPLIGSLTINSTSTNSSESKTHIPAEYLGFAPYPVVSEVSFDVFYVSTIAVGTTTPIFLRAYIRANIELYNPYPVAFNNANATLEYCMRGITWNMTHTIISTNATHTHRYGCYGNWTDSTSSIEYPYNSAMRDAARPPTKFAESYMLTHNPYGQKGIFIPAFSKKKYNLSGPTWGTYGQAVISNPSQYRINSITDVQCAITYVKIAANSNIDRSLSGKPNLNPESIRDWVLGADINKFITNSGNLSASTPAVSFPVSANTTVDWRTAIANSISTYSYQRLCPLIKTSIAASANLTANPNTICWTVNASTANHTFGNVTSGSNITTTNSTEQWNHADANPNFDSGNAIPSDPSFNNRNGNAVYASNNASDMREPYLVTGNYTSPADLGLVPTNQRWRRLRMQMQPASEGALIPDWAMLDVISLGNSTDSNNAFNRMLPVNINGRFHLPRNVTLAHRTIGIQALAQVLENSSADKIQDPMNPATSNSTDTTRFRGNTVNATTIVNNIGNMAWSTSSAWANRRTNKNFPTDQYILPSEIMEIAGVTNEVDQTNYTNSSSHFKWNEGRASALIPAVTTRSSFFTIYAYAQAGRENPTTNQFEVDSEALTKTLVEVEITTPATATTPAEYKVKKLYSQNLPMGD